MTEPIVLAPGDGRAYEVGPMRGVFKADGPETDDRWIEAPKGTFLRIPPGVTHDFENRTDGTESGVSPA